jgi:hypothetical protein
MNIFKKIQLFFFYKKVINDNKEELLKKFNIRIDDIYRMYTVVTIDEDEFKKYGGDAPVLYKIPDIDTYLDQSQATRDGLINGEMFLQKKVSHYLFVLEQYLNEKGLIELFGMSSNQKIDKQNRKIVIEYRFISTKRIADISIILLITSVLGVVGGFTYKILSFFM